MGKNLGATGSVGPCMLTADEVSRVPAAASNKELGLRQVG
jgi:hypothetical protein